MQTDHDNLTSHLAENLKRRPRWPIPFAQHQSRDRGLYLSEIPSEYFFCPSLIHQVFHLVRYSCSFCLNESTGGPSLPSKVRPAVVRSSALTAKYLTSCSGSPKSEIRMDRLFGLLICLSACTAATRSLSFFEFANSRSAGKAFS